MIRKLLSAALLSVSCFYTQAQVSFSPAMSANNAYSYNFGEVLQDTTGGKHHRDITFTLEGFSANDSYSIKVISKNLASNNNSGCTVTEEAPFSIQTGSTGTIKDGEKAQFTIRFNPKAIPTKKFAEFVAAENAKVIVPNCVADGKYADNYGAKTAKIQITRTPFCPVVDVVEVKDLEARGLEQPLKVTRCPLSTVYEISLNGASVSSFATFSPAVRNSETGKHSYDFGEALQDTAGGKHNKDITFVLGGGLEEKGTFSASLIQTASTHTNGSCSSSEQLPYSIVSGATGTYSTNKEIVVRFNPRNIKEMQQVKVEEVKTDGIDKVDGIKVEQIGRDKVELDVVNKGDGIKFEEVTDKVETSCVASGKYVDNYGTKTAILRVVFTPFCNNVVSARNGEGVSVACPKSIIHDIELTGESVAKLTNTSTSVYDVEVINFVVYPNPVSDVLNFNGEGALYTLQGQLVASGENKIDVSSLANGLYILQTQYGATKIIKE